MDAATADFGARFTRPQVLDGLLIAWVQDPDGHPIQLLQRLTGR
ncbi:MAG TPA: hypothetical protein VHV75_04305 [Solirubrobacteraceae bacterium]|jgi:hypothetical protein|nr:hypothetical protein [Solirubrobacteraceae bacterium]